MSMLSNEKGIIGFKTMFWLVLLFLVVHVILKVVPMWMDYSSMEDALQGRASMGQAMTDVEIKSFLKKKAAELELPLTEDSFIIERNPTTSKITRISTNGGWDVEMHFLWGAYVRTFHFEPVTK